MDFNVFVEQEITNISGKLQIISGKSQNNVLNNVKQVSSNGVIIYRITYIRNLS